MKKVLFLFSLVMFGLPSQAISFMFDFSPANAVTGITHDDTKIYCATRHKGLVVIDKITGGMTWYTKESGLLPSNNLIDVVVHDGNLWVSDFNLGALTCVSENKTDTLRTSPIQSFSNIVFSVDGKMIVSHGGYVDVYEHGLRTDSVTICPAVLDGSVWKMKADSRGTLWITSRTLMSHHGLSCYTPENGFAFVLDAGTDYPFKDNSATGLAIDGSDHVWFCSGFSDLIEYDGSVFHKHSLGFRVVDMAFDAYGTLWLLAADGSLKSFVGSEIADHSGIVQTTIGYCLDVDGKDVYLGTDQGLLKYSDGEYTLFDFSNSPALVENAVVQSSLGVQNPVYDLSGRQVGQGNKMTEYQGNKLPKGIYIQNGRKFVVK